MSRAINIEADVVDVIAVAAKHQAAISAIEPLVPSGTRVVFTDMAGADAVRQAYGERVLTGAVTRTRWRQ